MNSFWLIITVLWTWILIGLVISLIKRIAKNNKIKDKRHLEEFEKKIDEKGVFYNKNSEDKLTKNSNKKYKNKSKNPHDEISKSSNMSTRDYSKKLRDEFENNFYDDSELKDIQKLEAEYMDVDPYFDPNFKVSDDETDSYNLEDLTGVNFGLKEAFIAKEILDKPLALRK